MYSDRYGQSILRDRAVPFVVDPNRPEFAGDELFTDDGWLALRRRPAEGEGLDRADRAEVSDFAGSSDWWSIRPTVPIPTVAPNPNIVFLPVANAIVAAGEQHYFHTPEYTDVAHVSGTYGWFRVQSSAEAPAPTFTNNGLIVARTSDTLYVSAMGISTVQYAIESFEWLNWTNSVSGAIYADNAVPNHGSATGVYVTARARMTNAGLIQATGDRATGIVTASTVFLTNEATGVIRAWAETKPGIGVVVGTLDNRGLIEVSSRGAYSSVGVMEAYQVINSGTIRVHTDDAGQTTGVDIGVLYAETVVNSGLIDAERALWFNSASATLNNSGVIRGDIVGGARLTNTGAIHGDVFLANTGGAYAGESGSLFGTLYLGRGTNTVRLGAGDDVVLGHQTGTNTIATGDGDDLIDIIGGSLALDGGAGFDFLTFEFLAGSAVDVNLGSGVISGGASGTVQNVEAVAGSAGNDRIIGAGNDDFLFGGEGMDVLNGAAGDDFLDGGSGDDQLSGGSGDDRLTGGTGNDIIIGGEGYDTLMLEGDRASYRLVIHGSDVMVKGPDGRDLLYGVELIRFTGGGAFDLLRRDWLEDEPGGWPGTDSSLVLPSASRENGRTGVGDLSSLFSGAGQPPLMEFEYGAVLAPGRPDADWF